MKQLPCIVAFFALFNLSTYLFAADIEITFNDSVGQSISSTDSDAGSWSGDSLQLGDGTLNIGYTAQDKSPVVNNNNTTSRYTLQDALTSGKHNIDVTISAFDYSASDVDFNFQEFSFNTAFSLQIQMATLLLLDLKVTGMH